MLKKVDYIPESMIRVARGRVAEVMKRFGRGHMTLSALALSCYMQGFEDLVQVLADKKMLKESVAEIPEFEVM